MTAGRLVRIAGSIAEVRPLGDASLYELVHVGDRRLLAEVVRLMGDTATIQIHEDTTGLRLGEPVERTGRPLEVELGPGLLGQVLDGVGRPLARLAAASGDFLAPGADLPTLDRSRRWGFAPRCRIGDDVAAGDVLGEVEEQLGFRHLVLVPPGAGGRVAAVHAGDLGVDDPAVTLGDGKAIALAHRWPVRLSRPVGERLRSDRPLVTGQRILDLLFPVAEGGSVAVPGGFGTGKTVIEHSLAKFAAADVVVFVGCGERGNEMAEVLEEFPALIDPRTGRSIMERTVLVVNTSNMPVVAREASVYLGLTVAEYYRDMGLRVAVMVDSLSRWAEALRDIGSRLQEMPGDEGYPAHLASRLAGLYERTGRARAAGRPARDGAVTLVCAVSPPGGDFSEPVTQASLRVAGALWALDASLAHQRQFPAVDWQTSYSLYVGEIQDFFVRATGPDWPALRGSILSLLQRDAEVREVAALLGADSLQDVDRLVLEVAAAAREHVLGQSAYDPNDATSGLDKTYQLARCVDALHRAGRGALDAGRTYDELDLEPARRAIAELRRAPAARVAERAGELERAIAALGRPA
jgi:V/A-type H+-transporting ATPase subunit A